jgi:hypothetical protein
MARHLFLDIDGVLIRYKTNQVDPTCLENVKKLIRDHDLQVVISSDWRKGHSPESLKDELSDVGIDIEFYSMTPTLCNPSLFAAHETDYTRRDEIKEWLKHNPSDGFIILEDFYTMGEFGPNTLYVDGKYGFTKEDLFDAGVMLKEQQEDSWR